MLNKLINSISSAIGLDKPRALSLSYDEARGRISESEYRRLVEAWKRVVPQNSHMSRTAFFKEVLGDLFPPDLAEFLFLACGGSAKGILFKDLLAALVLLTRGTQEEKAKFIFAFYAGEGGTVVKEDFLRILTEVEGQAGASKESVQRLFAYSNSVEYEHFARWLWENRTVSSVSSWLLGAAGGLTTGFQLSDDHEAPTFYQTLAGVTHLEEEDIIELEKRYWQLQASSASGKFDLDTLSALVAPPLPPSILPGLFAALDENRDGHIDFKEMACGVSAAARGPLTERQKFAFKVFDLDRDGVLSVEEVEGMVSVMRGVLEESLECGGGGGGGSGRRGGGSVIEVEEGRILEELLGGSGGGLSLEEYLVWSLRNPLPEVFLNLLYQVCQVVLGLKPLDPAEEFEVVTAWLEREERRGLAEGQTWFLVSMEWWNAWLNHTSPNPPVLSNSDSGVGSIVAIGPESGSTESRGSSSRSSGRNCWSFKKSSSNSQVESAVAMDASGGVVVTGIRAEAPLDFQSSASSVSLTTLDSSCSSTPSPETGRRGNRRGRRPGAIDNSNLLAPFQPGPGRTPPPPSLTGEGGRLRLHLMEGRDFKTIPKSLWQALQAWYGVGVALPRQVILNERKELELELNPLILLLYRHAPMGGGGGVGGNLNKGASGGGGGSSSPWAGMAGAYGAAALYNHTPSPASPHFPLSPPKRVLSFTAAFSRTAPLGLVMETVFRALNLPPDSTRLDLLTPDDLSFFLVLEDEKAGLEDVGVGDKAHILIETRNKDQTWPEEIGSLQAAAGVGGVAGVAGRARSLSTCGPVEKGLTGLNNLGNTCFMNSALQCVSNTRPLTLYFLSKMHMYELNRSNPIGMKGHVAKRYGDLIQDLWSGTLKSIAPLKLRWTIGKYAPRFSGFNQNDAQELLAFLLDGLHEDLNRVTEKPYVELKDSNSRPDVVCAQEAWENHLLRNKSIVVDLFHGQLKSSVQCRECHMESTRFDPFNYLTLPLPMESYVLCDIVVVRESGATPTRYGLLATMEERIRDVRDRLAELIQDPALSPEALVLGEIRGSRLINLFSPNQRVKGAFSSGGAPIYAYELNFQNKRGKGAGGVGGGEQQEQQIQRILTSVKNSRPSHSRQSSLSSGGGDPPSLGSSGGGGTIVGEEGVGGPAIVVLHRKNILQKTYFLASGKSSPVLFGMPLLVPFVEGMTHLDLYKRVWSLVARLLSPLPPQNPEGPNISNHAHDCDDSLGYEYPFALRLVQRGLETVCGRCEWFLFCRGCPLACAEEERLERLNWGKVCLVIDWDPTALHLRYQVTQEFECREHPSLEATRRKLAESVALSSCLQSFTKEEELSEDEKYMCAKCKTLQLATKKLQIWRLPPVLIVHFKRFQHVQGRWVKSHKAVQFPFHNLNPTPFLADVPRLTAELGEAGEEGGEGELHPLQDFHQHRLLPNRNPFNLDYQLYAIVCHSGIMGGGHYVAYSKNGNGKWYCFNDSSCREVAEDQIETSSAYMLFYERVGLDGEAYLPRLDPRATPQVTEDELEAEENDLRKICTAF